MTRTMRYWLPASVMLSVMSGCVRLDPTVTEVVLDQRRPYRIAEPLSVTVWGKTSDGKAVKQTTQIPAGWWVAGPLVLGE